MIAKSYNTNLKFVEVSEAKVPRAVRVHPVPGTLLTVEKKSGGWERMMKRPPEAHDPRGSGTIAAFHKDMKKLGMRSRRQHDFRRTVISMCLGDDASKDILRWITHAPEGDVVDDYMTLVWLPLCREVAKL